MKKIILCLAGFLWLLCAACSLEITAEEVQTRFSRIIQKYPSTTEEEISLSKMSSGRQSAYNAVVRLKWSEKQGRFSTERALEQYSRELAAEVSQRIPMVLELELSWIVPFHAEDEAAMIFSYSRRKEGLTQTALDDRFTDGTFGADAYIDPNAMVDVPVRRIAPSPKTDKNTTTAKDTPSSSDIPSEPEEDSTDSESTAGLDTADDTAQNEDTEDSHQAE
ncbi:MAG: hypothetical protein HFH26_10660 [Clostridiaceae bacterium]|nr:hypothetical protein [Clostridiaceae bacterium]